MPLLNNDWSDMKHGPFGPPRKDGMALGFGIAYVAFGLLGLLHATGNAVPSMWLYPVILVGLGAAGIVSLISNDRQ